MSHKALVLGTNYYIGLSIARCLGKKGIHVVSIDYSTEGAYGQCSKYIKEKLIAPHYKNQEKAFLEYLLAYGNKQEKKPMLFPSADVYVEFIDKYLDELRESFILPNIKKGLYTDIINKETLDRYAKKFNMFIPESVDIDTPNFYEIVKSEIKYPCIIKPSDSQEFVKKLRIKSIVVKNEQELKEGLALCKKNDCQVFVQRIIKGKDDCMHTYDAYLDKNSNVTHWMTGQKQRQYPINFGASVYTRQKYIPELHKIGGTFLKQIEWKGFAEIEFKKDPETGNFYLIEINTRTTNFNAMIEKCGLNMPYIAYQELVNGKIEPKCIEEDLEIYFWYAYEDFFACRGYIKTNQWTRMEIIKSLMHKKAYAVWSLKDPKPFFSFLGMKLNSIFRKR